jgi:hypothetical protein
LGRGQPRGVAAGGERVTEHVEAIVDAARGLQRTLGPAGIAVGKRGGDFREGLAQLAEQRLGGAGGEQRGIGREQKRAHDERDAAADQRLEETTGRQGRPGGLQRSEQQRRHPRL